MKTNTSTLSLVAVSAAALLTSCVDPYYAGTTSATVTTYSPGYVVNTLPNSYETVTVSGIRYYRHDNVYFRPQGRSYVVVDAPRGYDRHHDNTAHYNERSDYRRRGYGRGETTVIRTLPNGARTVTHRGTRYYQAGDRYYRPTTGGYVVVANPF